jgi:hypothetical protein
MYETDPEQLLGTERSWQWQKPRSLLVYAAREWCGLRSKDLGEELHPDASMISRLHANYAANRDQRGQSQLRRLLETKVNNSGLPPVGNPYPGDEHAFCIFLLSDTLNKTMYNGIDDERR